MNHIPLSRREQRRTRKPGVWKAACLMLLLPSAVMAANIYPVRRGTIEEQFGKTDSEFAKAIAPRVPVLSKEDLYWRLDFLSGALTYAMADFGLIKRPASVPESTHRQRAAKALIRFAAAGFQADAS